MTMILLFYYAYSFTNRTISSFGDAVDSFPTSHKTVERTRLHVYRIVSSAQEMPSIQMAEIFGILPLTHGSGAESKKNVMKICSYRE